VVVVAPATAVAGAATTTEAQWGHALLVRRICRRNGSRPAGFPYSREPPPTPVREKIIAERAGLYA
jgi:hypothetical protein